MTQREQNRLREHGAAGHQLVEGGPNTSPIGSYATGTARLYTCACGWLGWMRAGLLT